MEHLTISRISKGSLSFPTHLQLTEIEERTRVIEEAHSWIGTPYFWLSDRKGVGIDCAMFLVRIFVDTGIVAPFDPRPYPAEWHLHQDEERYLDWIYPFAAEKADGELIPGDVLLFHYGRTFSHSGVYIGNNKIIHAFLPDRVCMKARLEDVAFKLKSGKDRRRKVFDIWHKKRETI